MSLWLLAASQTESSGIPPWVPVLTAVLGLGLGFYGHAVKARSDRQSLKHEKEKYADARRDRASEDFFKASDALGKIQQPAAAYKTRQAQAVQARNALIGVYLTIGHSVGGDHFDRLLDAFDTVKDEADLARAAALWPDVEKKLISGLTREAEEYRRPGA